MVVKEVAKALNKGALRHKILMSNPYMMSLLDPFNAPPALIPDDNMARKSSFSVLYRNDITVGTSGIAGIRLGGYYVHVGSPSGDHFTYGLVPRWTLDPTSGTNYSFILGQITDSTSSTLTDLFANNTGVAPAIGAAPNAVYVPFAWNPTAQGAPVASTFTGVRLVSAAVQASFTGTALNSSGLWTAAFLPRQGGLSPTSAPTGAQDATTVSLYGLQQLSDSIVTPVNRLSGAGTRYKPTDPTVFVFRDSASNLDLSSHVDVGDNMEGQLFVVGTGLAANSTIHIDAIFHYEGLTASNQFSLVDAHVSHSDPIAMSQAANISAVSNAAVPHAFTDSIQTGATLGGINPVPANSISAGTKPSSSDNSGSSSSWQDSVSSVLDTGKSIASTVSSIAKDLGPLLEGL